MKPNGGNQHLEYRQRWGESRKTPGSKNSLINIREIEVTGESSWQTN
jgi:hypothetical protein